LPSPDSPFETVRGEPRARRLIKELLAHIGRVRSVRWISLEFPDERIQSRPAVQAIAIEEVGRATAVQHVPIEGLAPADAATERLFTALSPLEQTPMAGVAGFDVDLSISLGIPGDFNNPKLIDTVEKIRDSCVAHGVAPGIQMRALPMAKMWRDRGMKFLGCGSEFGMLAERAGEIAKALKD